MIDNPKLTSDLLAKLEAALPLPAIVTPRLARVLRAQAPDASLPRTCQIVWVSNAGDEGGITCALSHEGGAESERAFVVSITHLDFDPRLPLAREIAAYQKRRTRKLRRLNG